MSNFAVRPQNAPLNLAYQIAWEQKYQELLLEFLEAHDEFDGSAVAAWMRSKGLHDPEHHNHWGVQIRYYAQLGWFKSIGHTIPTGAAHIASVGHWKSMKFKPRRP